MCSSAALERPWLQEFSPKSGQRSAQSRLAHFIRLIPAEIFPPCHTLLCNSFLSQLQNCQHFGDDLWQTQHPPTANCQLWTKIWLVANEKWMHLTATGYTREELAATKGWEGKSSYCKSSVFSLATSTELPGFAWQRYWWKVKRPWELQDLLETGDELKG